MIYSLKIWFPSFWPFYRQQVCVYKYRFLSGSLHWRSFFSISVSVIYLGNTAFDPLGLLKCGLIGLSLHTDALSSPPRATVRLQDSWPCSLGTVPCQERCSWNEASWPSWDKYQTDRQFHCLLTYTPDRFSSLKQRFRSLNEHCPKQKASCGGAPLITWEVETGGSRVPD